MESLNKIFTEEQVNEVSKKIVTSSLEKITDDLSSKFYKEIEDYIYEFYLNAKGRIEGDLIKEITEEFVKNPMLYKYAKLREQLFNENKELLTKTLSDEAIFKSVENVIWDHTHRTYQFNWKWKEAIVQIVLSNWNTFKDDEKIQSDLTREIERLKIQNSQLQNRISELSEIINQ